MRTSILTSLALLLTSVLTTPVLPSDQPTQVITPNAPDAGVNLTGFAPSLIISSTTDTGPILQQPPPPHPTCACTDCGDDGQCPIRTCADPTFEDHTTDSSPLADDCMVIVKNVQLGGKWDVESVICHQHQLVQWGTCALGVKCHDRKGGYYELGNLDVQDIITQAVDRFAGQHGGRVQASGGMRCHGSLFGFAHSVVWEIYHTK